MLELVVVKMDAVPIVTVPDPDPVDKTGGQDAVLVAVEADSVVIVSFSRSLNEDLKFLKDNECIDIVLKE